MHRLANQVSSSHRALHEFPRSFQQRWIALLWVVLLWVLFASPFGRANPVSSLTTGVHGRRTGATSFSHLTVRWVAQLHESGWS